MKYITTLKGWLGGLFLINAETIFTLVDKVHNTTATRYVTIVNLILAVVCVYFAFKLESLVKTSFKFVYYTIWFGLLYSIIVSLLTKVFFIWIALYIVVSIVIIYNLNKVKKELSAAITRPPAV